MTIRSERRGDEAVIADLVRRAYADVAWSDHGEHRMIARLRNGVGFIPALSLIAGRDGEAVGHVLLTCASIRDGNGAVVPTLALAPLSVVPDHRGTGVGRALVEAAHARAAASGFGSIVLVGNANYYPRFGYHPLDRYPITLPFATVAAERMIVPLHPDALAGVAGRVDYAPGWLAE